MKKLLTIFFLCAMTANAADRVTLTLTVTNVPAGHNTLTVNANVRTWTNSATASPASLILIGASIGASSTNLFRQIATTPYSGPLDIAFSSTNVITLRGQVGQALTASISGTWATLSYSTQTVATLNVVRVPASAEPTQSTATNIFSLVSTNLGTYSTNALAPGTTLVGNLVQTTTAQTVAGVKTFSSAVIGTALDYSFISSNAAPSFKWVETGAAADSGRAAFTHNAGFFTLQFLDDTDVPVTVFTIGRSGSTATSFLIDPPITASSLEDCVVTNSTVSNSLFAYTNSVVGEWGYTRTNVTSLANGNNSGLNFNTKVYIKLKAGPAAAFAICGIAGGADGRVLIIDNSIAQNMTIANDSGVDPVAANRIYTRTGGDIATTAEGVVNLIYDSEVSRWIVTGYQP